MQGRHLIVGNNDAIYARTATGFDRILLAVVGSARRQRRGGRPFMISSASATAMDPSA